MRSFKNLLPANYIFQSKMQFADSANYFLRQSSSSTFCLYSRFLKLLGYKQIGWSDAKEKLIYRNDRKPAIYIPSLARNNKHTLCFRIFFFEGAQRADIIGPQVRASFDLDGPKAPRSVHDEIDFKFCLRSPIGKGVRLRLNRHPIAQMLCNKSFQCQTFNFL